MFLGAKMENFSNTKNFIRSFSPILNVKLFYLPDNEQSTGAIKAIYL